MQLNTLPSVEYAEQLLYEIQEAKRISGSSKSDYVYRRRTLNVGWAVSNLLRDIPFEEMEIAMYFSCDNSIKEFVKEFEKQMEYCKMNEVAFRKNLHSFYLNLARRVKAENKVSLLVEFNNALFQAGLKKGWSGRVRDVFSAYLSLCQQSITYFINDLVEYPFCVGKDGNFVTVPDIFPMIDEAQEEGESTGIRKFIAEQKGTNLKVDNKAIWSNIVKAFKKIGFDIKSYDDIVGIVGRSNNYGNNLDAILYYMDESLIEFCPRSLNSGYAGFPMPRVWYDNEYYKERLMQRNYTLPSETVYADFDFAGGMKRVLLRETFKDDAVVLIWKFEAVDTTVGNIDSTGYYIPSEKFFYSNYMLGQGGAHLEGCASAFENLILELYFLLTVRMTEEEENHKKRTKMIVCESGVDRKRVDRWNNQPVVTFSIKGKTEDKKSKSVNRTYNKGSYEYDDISIACQIRRLPFGWKASDEALENARRYGYELEDGYTFVLPFERKQRHIKEIAKI